MPDSELRAVVILLIGFLLDKGLLTAGEVEEINRRLNVLDAN